MQVKKIHRVVFLSPGTFSSETSSKEVPSWDIPTACEMSTQITERYNATPYAFYFETVLTHPPIPDGFGGTLRVEPRTLEKSGFHFLNGKVVTYDDVKLRNDPKEEILLSNMRYDPIVCQTANGFSHTAHFNERDVVVDAAGKIVERGDTPERIAYRKQNRSALS